VRAHLSLAGWARVAGPGEQTSALAALATVFRADVAGLSGPWSDRVLLVVEPVEGELHWPHGCTRLDREEYVLADADPLAADEGPALDRVARACSERLLGMVRRLGRLTFLVPRDTVADAEAAIHTLVDHHEHCRTR
jgi:hypothetical protein